MADNATEKDSEFDALKAQAEAAAAAGEMDRAGELYTAAIAIRPELGLLLGQHDLSVGRRGQAVKWYLACHNATAHAEVRQICLINIGLLQLNWGFYPQAERLFLEALKIGKSTVALGNLGLLRMYQERLPEARDCLMQVLTDDPQFKRAHFTLGVVLLAMGQFSEGWERYRFRFGGAMTRISVPDGLEYPDAVVDNLPATA